MNDVTRILLPTDFSLGADHALRHAVAFARRAGASLHVLHVVERDDDVMLEFPLMEELFDSVRTAIARVEHDISGTEATANVRVRCAVRGHSDVVRCILEYVSDYGIDLVVISPFSYHRDDELRSGSTAEMVTRLAPCDVLTTGGRLIDHPGASRRILVPIDFSPASRAALESARALAHRTNGHLTLLHVQESSVFPADLRSGASIGIVQGRPLSGEDLETFYRNSRGPDVPRSFRYERGHPAARIASFADNHGMHLIVQGSRGVSGLSYAVLGSVAEGVVRRAACPVLTVKSHSHTLSSSPERMQPPRTRTREAPLTAALSAL